MTERAGSLSCLRGHAFIIALFLLCMGRLGRGKGEFNSERNIEGGGKMWEEKELCSVVLRWKVVRTRLKHLV